MLALLLSSLVVLAPQQEKPEYEMTTYQFVMLMDAKAKPALTEAKAKELQAAHLKYLHGLWKSRKAVVLGPIAASSDQKLRGIVVLDVRTKKEGEEIMGKDPWIKAGQLEAQIRPWFSAKGIVRFPDKPSSENMGFGNLEQMWLGLLVRPDSAPAVSKEEGAQIQAGHMKNIEKMAAEGALIWAGPFQEDTPYRGVFVFRNLPHEKLFEMVAQDPAVQKGRLKMDLYPWMTPAGSWPARKLTPTLGRRFDKKD